MAEVIFVSGQNCCGKTQLAYALWGCKWAADGTHYDPTEMISGKVTVIPIKGCSCTRLYEEPQGEKYLLVDGAPLGLPYLPPLVKVASDVKAVELWIRGCYYRSLPRSQFAQYNYPTSLRRVYFEFVTDGELSTERNGEPVNLRMEARKRQKELIKVLAKQSDRRVRALRAHRTKRERAEGALQKAKALFENVKTEYQRFVTQKTAIETQLSNITNTVTTITEGMIQSPLDVDVTQVMENVTTHPDVIAVLPTIQDLVNQLLPVNRQVVEWNHTLRIHIEKVRALERQITRNRATATDFQNKLREELRKNAMLHEKLDQLKGKKK